MAFSDAVTNDLENMFNTDEFATEVTYSTTAIDVIIDYGSSGKKEDENEDFRADKATMQVKVSDVASPAYRDEITIGSDTWYVQRIIEGDADIWLLGIEKGHRPELL